MEPTEENVRAWEHRHAPEAAKEGLSSVVRERLPELRGRHVLHLGAGAGTGTLELVRLGALVTAVEPDRVLLEAARTREPTAAWLEAPLDGLPLELGRGRFHLALADHTLGRIADLAGWARGLETALRPGGYLLLHDDHPLLRVVDPLLHWRGDFRETLGLGQLVTALARTGLVVRRLEELPAPRPRQGVPGEVLLVARKPSPEG
jgi:SAM-dependent methyltransferase